MGRLPVGLCLPDSLIDGYEELWLFGGMSLQTVLDSLISSGDEPTNDCRREGDKANRNV